MLCSTCNPLTYLIRAVLHRGSAPLTGVTITTRDDGNINIHVAYPPATYTVARPPTVDETGKEVYFGPNIVIVRIPGDDDPDFGWPEEWRKLGV